MSISYLDSKNNKAWKKHSLKILWFTLPIVILYFVFQEIDLTQLKQNFEKTNPGLFFLALSLAPLLTVIGTFRWQVLLRLSQKGKIPLTFLFQHYWTGLALGFFVPASLGWDAYRIFICGSRFGNYTINIAVIVVEKLAALVTCMSIIVITYPLTTIVVHSKIEKIFYFANILLFVTLVFIVGLFALFQNHFFSKILNRIETYSAKILTKIATQLKTKNKDQITLVSAQEIIKSFANLKIISVVILSFAIQLVSAVKSQIFFNSLGYDLPFLVNLLITPTLFFIFILPISFGSIGIREGAYILLYGLFGVPAEIALLVSFFDLTGLLLNNAIGGLVILFSRRHNNLKTIK